MSRPLLVLLLILFLPRNAAADRSLPHDLIRPQGPTGHCWAYSASHFLESRAQARSGTAVALHTERDLLYWVFYNRFVLRYQTGRPFDIGGMADHQLLSEGGFAPEFIDSFLEHGHHVWEARNSVPTAGYEYPYSYTFAYNFLGWQRPYAVPFESIDLVHQLENARNLDEAKRMIRAALDASPYQLSEAKTYWKGEAISRNEVPQRMLGADVERLRRDDFVMLEIVSTRDINLHSRDTYMNGRFSIFHVTREEAEMVAAKLIEEGWPVLSHIIGHTLVIIAKQDRHFGFIDSNLGIVWNEGFASYRPNMGQPIAGITVPRSDAERILRMDFKSAPDRKGGRGGVPRIQIQF